VLHFVLNYFRRCICANPSTKIARDHRAAVRHLEHERAHAHEFGRRPAARTIARRLRTTHERRPRMRGARALTRSVPATRQSPPAAVGAKPPRRQSRPHQSLARRWLCLGRELRLAGSALGPPSASAHALEVELRRTRASSTYPTRASARGPGILEPKPTDSLPYSSVEPDLPAPSSLGDRSCRAPRTLGYRPPTFRRPNCTRRLSHRVAPCRTHSTTGHLEAR